MGLGMSWRQEIWRGLWRRAKHGVLLAPLALSGACETRPDNYDEALSLSEPAAIDGALVYSVRARRGLVALDVGSGTPRFYPLGLRLRAPTTLAHDAAAALDDSGKQLVVLRSDGSSAVYALGGEFDTLWPAEDGTHVLVSRGGTTQGLTNATEVALVALDAPPGSNNPARRSLPSAGTRISRVVLSPDGALGRLVFFLSPGHVAVLPVEGFATATPRSIPLGAEITPRLARFDVSAADALDVFLAANGTEDLVHLHFVVGAEGGVPLPTLNLLPTDAGGADDFLIIPPLAGAPRTLLAPTRGTQSVALIDPATGVARHYGLEFGAVHAVAYDGGDGGGSPEVLLYANNSARFARVVLMDLPTKKSKAIQGFDLAAPVAEILPAAGGTHFVVRHQNASVQLTLVDAATAGLTPFAGTDAIRQIALSGDTERVFALSDGYPGTLTEITVRTAATRTLDLPTRYGDQALRLVPDGAEEWVTLSAQVDVGLVSFTRDLGAWSTLEGFAVSGVLDEEVP